MPFYRRVTRPRGVFLPFSRVIAVMRRIFSKNNFWYRVINTELSSQNLFELTLQFFAMLHSLRGESILKT